MDAPIRCGCYAQDETTPNCQDKTSVSDDSDQGQVGQDSITVVPVMQIAQATLYHHPHGYRYQSGTKFISYLI